MENIERLGFIDNKTPLEPFYADVVELVDSEDLGSSAERCVGSNPIFRTMKCLSRNAEAFFVHFAESCVSL